MAKFSYEVIDSSPSLHHPEVFKSIETKKRAQAFIKNYNQKTSHLRPEMKKKLSWERWITIESIDFIDGKGEWRFDVPSSFSIFEESEGTDYRRCPWAGIATEVCRDEKYVMYHTTNVDYSGKQGFYLVDINPRAK